MKWITGLLFSVVMAGVSMPSWAAPNWPRVQVMEVAVDVSSTSTIFISHLAPTAVLGSTVFGSTVNVWGIEVYNFAGSAATINCGFSASVSTKTNVGNAYGREVVAGQGILWQADFNKNVLRCLTQSITAGTSATITLFR